MGAQFIHLNCVYALEAGTLMERFNWRLSRTRRRDTSDARSSRGAKVLCVTFESSGVDSKLITPDQLKSLAVVFAMLRSGKARTRTEISERTGLGRTVVAQRLGQLSSLGFVESAGIGVSTGGRAPGQLRFRAEAGTFLVAMLGATSLAVGLADLSGYVVDSFEEEVDVVQGPEVILQRLEEGFDRLIKSRGAVASNIWGVGISVPGPVEFATGRPCAPPIMPGWDGYPVRERFESRYGASTWVDNEVNALALGELRAGLAQGEADVLYVKMGTGIGAGLISRGLLHRGAMGCAGDIGHTATVEDEAVVCRCGKTGCLEALASGSALARDGTVLATTNRSAALARVLERTGAITAEDVAKAASRGDRAARDLMTNAGRLIGETLATLVSFFNPSLVVLGGGLVGASDHILAVIRETVYRRSLPLATRELRISPSLLADQAGLVGAAFMVADELFSVAGLAQWIDHGTPEGIAVRTAGTRIDDISGA